LYCRRQSTLRKENFSLGISNGEHLNYSCKICDGQSNYDSKLFSEFSNREFIFAKCKSCGFGWVVNPRTDYSNIYDDSYYRGKGVDPVVKFSLEIGDENEKSNYYKKLRYFEYSGWFETLEELRIKTLKIERKNFRVLDYGGGLGGLTTYLNGRGIKTDLYDVGFGFEQAKKRGVPTIFGEIENHNNYDIVISLQVIEHLIDPLDSFLKMKNLLKHEGVIIADTGNLLSHKDKISKWFYAQHPEVHIAFWTPESLKMVGTKLNFVQKSIRYNKKIIQYKILHSIQLPKPIILLAMKLHIFWKPLATLADRVYGVSQLGILVKSEIYENN